jgi:hypothetical protein
VVMKDLEGIQPELYLSPHGDERTRSRLQVGMV